MTCQHTTTLGVYLLGALEPLDRSEFESHLSRCDTCPGELVRLAPLPGLLNQISIEDFADDVPLASVDVLPNALVTGPDTAPVPIPPMQQGPEPALPAPDVPVISDTRRSPRRYWQLAAAAAVVLVVTIGGFLGWRAIDGGSPQPPGVTWSATGADDVTADARLVDHEWGTEIMVKVANLPQGRECYLIVLDKWGNRQVAGWWRTDHDPNVEIPASSSVPRSKIVGLEIKLDDRSLAVAIPAPNQ